MKTKGMKQKTYTELKEELAAFAELKQKLEDQEKRIVILEQCIRVLNQDRPPLRTRLVNLEGKVIWMEKNIFPKLGLKATNKHKR